MTTERRILIIGRNGQLARELAAQDWAALSWAGDIRPVFQGRNEIDLFRLGELGQRIRALEPALIVNAVGYTSADRAEQEPEAAFLLNATAPDNLATIASALNIPLIHLSSDHVFDGAKDRAYSEGDPVAPISALGESKAAGEAAVIRAAGRHLILRTSWLFGLYGDNFVKTMLFMGRLRRQMSAVDDQFGCPTPAASLAEAVRRIALEMIDGRPYPAILHYCGDRPTTWFGFAQEIFTLAAAHQPAPQLSATTSAATTGTTTGTTTGATTGTTTGATLEALHAKAALPRNSALDCGLAHALGLAQPDWRAELVAVVETLLQDTRAAETLVAANDAA